MARKSYTIRSGIDEYLPIYLYIFQSFYVKEHHKLPSKSRGESSHIRNPWVNCQKLSSCSNFL